MSETVHPEYIDPESPAADEQPAPPSHDSLYRKNLRRLAAIVEEKQAEVDRAAAQHREAKAELDQAYQDLLVASKDEQEYLPFTAPPEGAPGPQDEGLGNWRAVPLDEALLGLGKAVYQALAEAGLKTMGDLAEFSKGRRLTDLAGIGPGKAGKVEEAVMAFWERRRGGGQFRVADTTPADLAAQDEAE